MVAEVDDLRAESDSSPTSASDSIACTSHRRTEAPRSTACRCCAGARRGDGDGLAEVWSASSGHHHGRGDRHLHRGTRRRRRRRPRRSGARRLPRRIFRSLISSSVVGGQRFGHASFRRVRRGGRAQPSQHDPGVVDQAGRADARGDQQQRRAVQFVARLEERVLVDDREIVQLMPTGSASTRAVAAASVPLPADRERLRRRRQRAGRRPGSGCGWRAPARRLRRSVDHGEREVDIVATTAAHQVHLLVLPKHGDVGLDHVEQLGDDRQHAVEAPAATSLRRCGHCLRRPR